MSARGDEVLFAGGGELGARMQAIDWAKTPLGPVRDWPQSLKTCVRVVLTSRQPMFVWWGDELINLYNDAYKAIVGGKHPEALGQPAALVWREIWDQVGPRARSAMRDNEGTYDEALLLIMERNGYPEETYYTFSYSPVPNDAGGTGGILCANTDDTLRILGERQLALLRMVASETGNMPTVEQVCERAASCLEHNPRDVPFAAIYLTGADRQLVTCMARVGIDAGHAATPSSIDLRAAGSGPIAQALSSQQVQLIEHADTVFHALPRGAWDRPPSRIAVVPFSAGGERGRSGALLVGINPFRLLDENYRGFLELLAGQVGASLGHAEAYAEERKRAEALAEIDRAKTAFFSNVSHEFRTPLTLMLGPMEDALSTQRGALSGEDLETAYRNALRLLKLVNALLEFSRIEAGRADASFVPTDLAALTADLASAFRSAIERAGLAFELELHALQEPVYVDRDMWEKIVLNLLSNALKFTFEGRIGVRLTAVEGHVELTVSDTGSGIPPAELGNVFKRFHRVQGARSRTHEGSGIGLALVHELVEMHGGTISVYSELNAGTRFVVRIPRGTAHLPAERLGKPRAPSAAGTTAVLFVQEAERWLPSARGTAVASTTVGLSAAANAEPDTGPARVLIADDNADMREYLTRMLQSRWSVQAVSDGAQALEAVRAAPPSLILSDVMMPNLDGFQLLATLKRDPKTRHIPFIMLSARAGDEARVEGLVAGADDYLVKPFSARELMARIGTHVQLAALRATAERERQRLFDVFMQAPVPVAVLMGPQLRFEVANPAMCAMTGREIERGKTLREVFPELLVHPVLGELERVLGTGEPLHVSELSVALRRNQELREGFFNYAAQPLRNAGGGIDGVIVVATEVTEQVLARTRVNLLREEAERANRAKDDFLSTLSHELRTPLNAIVGWSSLLRSGGLDEERVARALETIERNAHIQARLVEDMLDLSRIEQGKLVLSVGPIEMVRVVEAALDAVRPAAEAKGVRLQPVLDSHATIVGDADRLQQVVWNLLSNAIKFTPRGGRVQVQLRRHQSHVEVVVADTGQGIAPEFLPFVFDRFRQADPSFTRKVGGLGLGLAIVRSLVELHGGTVEASSDGVSCGASFVVKLPTAPLRADTARAAQPRVAGEPVGATFECPEELKGLRILVVDDEPETRELLAFLLTQCEAHVQTAAGAHEALAALEQERYDVLISDIGMPDTDGYELIRRVRALDPKRGGAMPALALTAYARGEDRTQALRAGFQMHMSKPIQPSELLVVIATLVRSYSRR